MRRTSIHLDDTALDALRMLGRRQGRPVAELVREAVDRWLGEQGVRRLDRDEWVRRFDALLDRRRRIADEAGWNADEVERDVTAAIDDVRRARPAGPD